MERCISLVVVACVPMLLPILALFMLVLMALLALR